MQKASPDKDEGITPEMYVSKYFTAEDMKRINSIEILKSGDRSFIGEVLKILHCDNISAIHSRTLVTTSENLKVITPKKMEIITMMMNKRADKVSETIEKVERMSQTYINKTISKSFYYLKQTVKK